MRVLLLAPIVNKMAVSEPFVAFKWAEALSEHVDLTLLTFRPSNPEHGNLQEQLPNVEVVTWKKPQLPKQLFRLEAMLKPTYPVYSYYVRKWVRQALKDGRQFDLAHQIMPQAARYVSPLTDLGIPYIMGPLGGSVTTPDSFEQEERASSDWYMSLRRLDQVRFRYDPWLRRSFEKAEAVLGVAPYVKDNLADMSLKRFEPVLELGVDAVSPTTDRSTRAGLRLLHVGRAVRTKGLRDVVRAMALLKDLSDVTLVSAGDGPDLEICKQEAKSLGVADRITFLGQVPRSRVEDLYQEADVFVFPSFREAAGNVLYEAMRNKLPIIGADRGGPAFIIDEDIGFKLPVTDPQTYACDIASAVRKMYQNPEQRRAMGAAAHAKLNREGLWSVKAKKLAALYNDICPVG